MDVFNFISPERKREILARRAQRLASSTRPRLDPDDGSNFLCFSLGGRDWFLETARLQEVFPLKAAELSPLPGAPDYVLGATNVRGQVLGVLDTACLLRRSADETGEVELSWSGPHQPLLIVSHGGSDLGLLVESITGVVRSRPESTQPYQTLNLDRLLAFEPGSEGDSNGA